MAVLRELLARFNIRVDDDELRKGDKKLNAFKNQLQNVTRTLIAGGTVWAVQRFVRSQVELLDEIDKTSKQLGIGAEALQEYRFAAERSGVAQNTLDMGLQRFTRRLSEANKGTGEAKDALRELGVDTSADAEVALMQAADALSQVESSADRTRLAFKLFDSEGVRMLNMMQDGSEGLEQLREEARQTGGVFEKDTIQKGVEAADAMTNFKMTLRGLSSTFALEFLPSLTKGLQSVQQWSQRLQQSEMLVDALKWSVIGLATAIGAVLVVKFAALSVPLLIFGLLFLIADDFITLIEGGDSVIGRFLSSLFGLEDSTQTFELLKLGAMEVWRALRLGIRTVKSVGSAVISGVQAMMEAFRGMFSGVGEGFKRLITGDFQGAANALKDSFQPAVESARGALSDLQSAGRTGGKLVDMWRGLDAEHGAFRTEAMRQFIAESNRRHAQREKLRAQEQFAVKQGLLSPEEARAAREAAVRRGGVGRVSAADTMARNPNLGAGEQFAAQLAAGNIQIDVNDNRTTNADIGRQVEEKLNQRDRDVAEAVSDDQ